MSEMIKNLKPGQRFSFNCEIPLNPKCMVVDRDSPLFQPLESYQVPYVNLDTGMVCWAIATDIVYV